MMYRHALLVLCLLGLPALFLAGCSDNAQPPGNQVALTVFSINDLQTYTPLWAAFQDGAGGEWTSVTGSGTYTVNVTDPAGAYGFAVAVDTGMGIQVIYLQATLAEGRAITLPVYLYGGGSVRHPLDRITSRRAARARVTVDNTWDFQASIINIPHEFDAMTNGDPFGFGSSSPVSVTSTNMGFHFPAGRPGDLCMLLNDVTPPYDNGLLYLQRDLSHPAGTVVEEDIDFSAPYDGSKHTYEVTERSTVTAAGATSIEAGWVTANGTYLPLQSATSDTTDYPLIPDAVASENDRYRYYASSFAKGSYAFSFYWSEAPAASFNLPDDFTCGFSDDTFTGLDHPGASLYSLYAGRNGTFWTGLVTQTWLTAAGATSATLPDFSTTDGWQPAWGFSDASPVSSADVDKVEYNINLPAYLLHEADLNFLQPAFPDGTFLSVINYQAYPNE